MSDDYDEWAMSGFGGPAEDERRAARSVALGLKFYRAMMEAVLLSGDIPKDDISAWLGGGPVTVHIEWDPSVGIVGVSAEHAR